MGLGYQFLEELGGRWMVQQLGYRLQACASRQFPARQGSASVNPKYPIAGGARACKPTGALPHWGEGASRTLVSCHITIYTSVVVGSS